MLPQTDTFINDLGLQYGWKFAADRSFYAALAAAPLALLILQWIMPSWSKGVHLQASILLSLVIWQPLVEELLFRGVIQGQLIKRSWARRCVVGLSVANISTSLLFATAHLACHAAAWAIAVMLPSLVFGHFRDRYGHILPSVLLHAAYNGSYLLLGTYWATT